MYYLIFFTFHMYISFVLHRLTLSTSAYWSTLFPHVYAQKKRRSSSARQDLCSYARHCKASRTQRAKIAFYLARLVLTPRPNVIRQRRDSKNKSPCQNALGASSDVMRLLALWTLVYETRRSFSMGSLYVCADVGTTRRSDAGFAF